MQKWVSRTSCDECHPPDRGSAPTPRLSCLGLRVIKWSGSRGKAHTNRINSRGRLVARSIGVVATSPPACGFGSGIADFARQLWWERRLRSRFFPAEIFGEPAWDLILDAYSAQKAGNPLRLSKAHLSACVPPSISERSARSLAAVGIFSVAPVETGKRGLGITLTPASETRVESLLEETWFHRRLDPTTSFTENGPDRSVALRRIITLLVECREELDSLRAWAAGAHVSQAISAIDASGGATSSEHLEN